MFALTLLMLTAFATVYAVDVDDNEPPDGLGVVYDPYVWQQLLDLGFSEEMLEMFMESEISLELILNQSRFGEHVGRIYNNEPIGPSEKIIAPEYMGGMYFNDIGILTVTVLDAAFDHYDSAIAIEEMLEIGIIVRSVEFAYQELNAIMNVLNENFESVRRAGSTSWGLGTIENRVIVWLDPYNDEQKEIFEDFLLEYSLNPSTIKFMPAVTQEMIDLRIASIASAIDSPGDQIVLVGDIEVSRIGMIFSLENRTDYTFFYGAPWDLAYYLDGEWFPVPHQPGAGGGAWTMQMYSLQSGGIQRYIQHWDWRFGELPPGRYMFIRNGWLDQDSGTAYALVEFYITEDSLEYITALIPVSWQPFISFVEYDNVTSSGMTIVVENVSIYNIDHVAQIMAIAQEEYAQSEDWWQWEPIPLIPLPLDDNWSERLMQGQGFLPSDDQLEFTLDWTALVGELPPGDYKIAVGLGGRAHAPHPTGWAFGETIIISFTI